MGKMELKKGPWTREEDQKLLTYIEKHGHGGWRVLPSKAGLQRCGKSCRMRWTNYLSPEIKRGKFTPHEEKTIIRLHALLGNRWSAIANHLPKRTDNEIKNYWNTRLKKRLVRMGFDPVTHKPKNSTCGSSAQSLSHMAQWETARLEAEVRLVREAKQFTNRQLLRRATAPPPLVPPQPRCLDVLRVWQATNNNNNIHPHHISNFFDSFESPTSTLDFSGGINRITTLLNSDVTNFCASAAVEEDNSYGGNEKCKIENSMQFHHDNNNNDVANPLDYDMLTSSSMNFQNQSYEYYDMVTSVFDNWDDELVNLVNLPTSIAF